MSFKTTTTCDSCGKTVSGTAHDAGWWILTATKKPSTTQFAEACSRSCAADLLDKAAVAMRDAAKTHGETSEDEIRARMGVGLGP